MATAPRGLKAGGRRLWVSVTTDFDLDESASAVLTEAAYTVDLLAELRAKLADISVLTSIFRAAGFGGFWGGWGRCWLACGA